VIELHATMEVERLTVTVTDWGRWREPPADHGIRGRGLVLIRNLCTHTDVVATLAGTIVTMVWELGELPRH
jgi:serine/threonine-protein kinase RsbW